jgi:GTP:adenosylcobinamide-phosphate guanylyltransferase
MAQKATALVMAACRRGVDDPVAKLQNKSHKCLVEIDGVVMLERVIDTLLVAGCFERIYVSIESEEPLRTVPRLCEWLDQKRIMTVKSRDTLADSVLSAARDIPEPLPLIVTTGDNALHTPELIRSFMDQFWAHDGDVMVAFTNADVVRQDYPTIGLAYHILKDGGYSACNLYGLRREAALKTARIFESGGQFGKRHLRILKAFGIMPFILYKLKLVGLEQLMQRIGRNLGCTVDTAMLDYSFGPIDVDNLQFFAIAEETLKHRRHAA